MKFFLKGYGVESDILYKLDSDNGEYAILSGIQSDSGEISSFAVEAIEKVLHEAFNTLDLEQFTFTLNSLEILLLGPIIEGIKKLIDGNRFEHLRRLEYSLSKRSYNDVTIRMIYAFLQIINGTASWTDTEADELWKQIQQIEMPDEYIENLMSYYTVYAIVSAYIRDESRSTVAKEVTERYLGAHKYKRTQYFNYILIVRVILESG